MGKCSFSILINPYFRKGIVATVLALTALSAARAEEETIDGYTWTYRIVDSGAST